MFTQNSKPFRLLRRIAGYDLELRILPLSVSSLMTTILLIFQLTLSQSFAQKSKLDSLEKAVSKMPNDTNKVKALIDVAQGYVNLDTKKAEKYGSESIQLAEELNYTKGQLVGAVRLNFYLFLQGKYEDAQKVILKGMRLAKESKNLEFEGRLSNSMAQNLSPTLDLVESLSYGFRALEIGEKLDIFRIKKNALKNIGSVYAYQGDTKKALEYHQKALDYSIQKNEKADQAMAYNDIGLVYSRLRNYNEALKYNEKGLLIFEEINDLGNLVNSLNNQVANLYYVGDYRNVDKYLNKAINLCQNKGFKRHLYHTYAVKGMAYTQQKKFSEAEKSLIMAKNGADSLKYTKLQTIVLQGLANLYYASNQLEKGKEFYLKSVTLIDSLNEANNSSKIVELETKYKTAQKERQLTEAKLENVQKQKWIIGLCIAIFSILGFGIAFYKIREAKQKVILQEIEIEKQREILKAREIERQRIAKELHDSVGSQLTVVSTSLDNAFFLAENKKLVPQKLESINKDVREAAQSLRDTIWATHNTTVSVSNLFSRMQHYLQKVIKENSDTAVESSFSGKDIELNSIQALNFFRIFQEAIQNIQKHAEASKVLLLIQNENDSLRMRIEDNGKGFGINTKNLYENFGLSNMKTRSDEIGAKISIESTVDKGTIIEVIKEMSS